MTAPHITMLYAGILGLLLVVLAFNLNKNWVRASGTGHESDQGLRRAEGILVSFADYVPMTLVLIGVIEANGAPSAAIHLMGITLVTARIMHAIGSNFFRGSGVCRFLGAQLTYLVVTVASMACLYYYVL